MLKQASPHRYQQFLTAITQTPGALLRYLKHSGVDMPVVHLNVKHLDLQKLAFERHQFFMEEKDIDFQFVPASLMMEQQEYPIKIRLKGDRYIHISDPHKWSFRIHIKGEHALRGMKYFSLHRAGARNYLYEWIFHRFLKKEGFIALRYEFVELMLNGKSLGVYAMEEHFDKRLVEHNQFRNGPILKLDEDLTGDVLNMSVCRPFREEEWTDSTQQILLERACSRLEAFRRGEASIPDVFDVDKMATFFAITDILSVRHGSFWKSLRFYFNPVSDRLEPIGFDGHFHSEVTPGFFLAAQSSQRPHVPFHREHISWYDHVFFPSDTVEPIFFTAYVKALERFSSGDHIKDFFEEIEPELQLNLSRIYSDYPTEADHLFWYGPDMHFFSKDFFFEKQTFIQTELHPFKHMVLAFQDSCDGNVLQFEVSNVHTLPQHIKTLYIDSLQFSFPDPPILLPRNLSDYIQHTPGYQRISFPLPEQINWHDSLWQHVRIGYSVLGVEGEQITRIAPWRRQALTASVPNLMHRTPTHQQFGFIQTDETQQKIFIQEGKWDIGKDLVFPPGYTIIAGPRLRINLRDGASILSYSPLIWKGSRESPIRITNEDGSGEGLFLFRTDSMSYLSHVVFSRMAPPQSSTWGLTGAVSVYESPVMFEEVHWQSCSGEDALNLIRSRFEMSYCYFDQTESDAMDVDFCVGEMRECWFTSAGNDALDLSGSTVSIAGLTIEKTGDKGISIGEDARIEAQQIFIAHSKTGIAVKDHSSLHAHQIRLDSCQIGWAVYQKKPEYGGASSYIRGLIQHEVGIPHLIEEGSTGQLDDQFLPGSGKNIRAQVDQLTPSGQ